MRSDRRSEKGKCVKIHHILVSLLGPDLTATYLLPALEECSWRRSPDGQVGGGVCPP